ncbi:hypothetical protein, partial [Nocardia brasiliensis]|uniref:hypothetical protein n=1 Tax=Nocardia brasiliensis TaxID=37326 RepID=UPI00245656A0
YDTAVEEDAAISALAAQLTAISAGRPQLWIGVAAAVRPGDIPAANAEAQAVAEVARARFRAGCGRRIGRTAGSDLARCCSSRGHPTCTSNTSATGIVGS